LKLSYFFFNKKKWW